MEGFAFPLLGCALPPSESDDRAAGMLEHNVVGQWKMARKMRLWDAFADKPSFAAFNFRGYGNLAHQSWGCLGFGWLHVAPCVAFLFLPTKLLKRELCMHFTARGSLTLLPCLTTGCHGSRFSEPLKDWLNEAFRCSSLRAKTRATEKILDFQLYHRLMPFVS